MDHWEGAFVVLFEAGPNQSLHYEYEIYPAMRERRLCGRLGGRTPWKSVGTAMRRYGREYIEEYGWKSGRYRLKDFDRARSLYEYLREREPWRFPLPATEPAQGISAKPTPSQTANASPTKLNDKVVAASKSPPKLSGKTSSISSTDSAREPRKRSVARLREPEQVIPRQLIAEEVAENELRPLGQTFLEGRTVQIRINKFERDQNAREKCIRLKKARCKVCGFRFEDNFGDIGKGFIHVHHNKPLSEVRELHDVDPEIDLDPVCPNCHAMLHKQTPPFSVEELREIRQIARRRTAARMTLARRKKRRIRDKKSGSP